MSLRDSNIGGLFYRGLERLVLPALQRVFSHPNYLTLMGFGLALLVPFGFCVHPLMAFLLMLLSGIADAADGLMARANGQTTRFGAFWDSSIDRLADACYLFGFGIMFWRRTAGLGVVLLLFTAVTLTLMISYVKARAEALGGRCPVGILERGLRTVYLLAWVLLLALLPGLQGLLLWTGLVLYCVLCGLTVVQRLLYIHNDLSARPM